jgi:hypothetical protein
MPTDRRPAGTRRGLKLLRVLAIVLGVLLLGEALCRVQARFGPHATPFVGYSEERHTVHGERVALIDILRASDSPREVFQLKPGLRQVPFTGAPLSTSSLGFRGPEAPEAGPDTITIVGIGDSMMFGQGVADGSDYLSMLQRRLREQHPEKQWRVLNLAAPSANTVMEVETLRRRGLSFEPDLVILHLTANDTALPQYVRLVDDPFDLRRSYLVELARWLAGVPVNRSGFELREGRDPRLAHVSVVGKRTELPQEYRDLLGWEPFAGALAELAALSQAHAFPVVTVSTFEDEACVRLIDAARAQGFATVRLMPEIREHLARLLAEHPEAPPDLTLLAQYEYSDLAVAPGDSHPSVLQHRMIATKLLAELEAQSFVARLLAK